MSNLTRNMKFQKTIIPISTRYWQLLLRCRLLVVAVRGAAARFGDLKHSTDHFRITAIWPGDRIRRPEHPTENEVRRCSCDYTLSSQLQRLTSFSVGCSGRRILPPGQINTMRKWSIGQQCLRNDWTGSLFYTYIDKFLWISTWPSTNSLTQNQGECSSTHLWTTKFTTGHV